MQGECVCVCVYLSCGMMGQSHPVSLKLDMCLAKYLLGRMKQ